MKPMLLLAVVLFASGCMSTNSYVGDKLPRVELSEIQPGPAPMPVRLVFEFQFNGKLDADATRQLRPKVVTAMAETGLFRGIQEDEAKDLAHLEIVMNDTGNASDAQAKGMLTGLTLGLAGSLVTDHYVWDATWTAPGREPLVKRYEHDLHTTVGNHSGPAGLEPVTQQQAVDTVIRQLVRITLRDLQNEAKVSG